MSKKIKKSSKEAVSDLIIEKVLKTISALELQYKCRIKHNIDSINFSKK